MTSRSASRLGVLALVVHLGSGCSWIFMERPPDVVAAPDYPVQCTSSRAAPIIDAVYAGSMALGGVMFAAMSTCSGGSTTSQEGCVDAGAKAAMVGAYAAAAVVTAVAASQGLKAARRCDDLKSLNALCITGHEDACRKLNSAWTPSRRPEPPGGWQREAPVDTPVPGAAGCTRDVDCKGSRVCERGVCVEPGGARPGP